MSEHEHEDKSGAGCVICGKPRDARFTPFCSKRCADVDLGRWLGGRYSIPAQDENESEASSGMSAPLGPKLN